VVGKTLGPYKILDILGKGGMGIVYKAHDQRLQRFVALKFLSESEESSARKRFVREAQAASALNHPNIVTIHDIVDDGAGTFIVMEFVEGRPLRELISAKGMPVQTALDFATQIAEGLAAAHAKRIVHRDLKPGNVIVTPKGRAKVLDFGLAKFESAPDSEITQSILSKADHFLGTVSYASPEQMRGRPVDHRADIFSLGVILHEMLTGERPFYGANTVELICAISYEAPKSLRASRPGLAEYLETLVARMLEKRPEDRFQSMDEVLGALGKQQPSLDPTVGFAIAKGTDTLTGSGVSATTSRGPRVPGTERSSIGVLPFRSLSKDPDDEYLAVGISSEIIRALSGVPGVRVPSQAASFRFKDNQADVREIARSLNCRYLLTGNLRRAGSRVRVVAELTDAAHETLLWSNRYDGSLEDVFAVQEEIANAIVGATGGQLIRVRAEEASIEAPEDLDPSGLVRRAYHFVNHAYHSSAIDDAIEMLRKAIAMEPGYAVAYAFLAFDLTQRMINNTSPDAAKDYAEALAAVERALELAPGDPEVLENAGLVLFNCFHAERALGVLRRAVEVAPFNLVAWGYLALCLGWAGDGPAVTEGRAILDRVLESAPDHPSLPYWLYFKTGVCARQGDFLAAADCARRSTEIQPRFVLAFLEYANALGFLGRHERAGELMAKVKVLSPTTTQEVYVNLITQTTRSPERAEAHLGGLFAAGIYTR
jgi:serine/threonine protein kinase/tetratricopeptide (TPR) repeat protein